MHKSSIATSVVYQPIQTDTKRGHSFFGGCCDMRRAVVILNIIQMALCLTGMIFFSEVGHVAAGVSTKINDEKVIKFLFFFLAFGFLLGGLSAIGAITYNKYFVSYNAVFLLIRFCLTFGFVPFLSAVLHLYPHLLLVLYIHKGIMTEDNYPIENQSCCCIDTNPL